MSRKLLCAPRRWVGLVILPLALILPVVALLFGPGATRAAWAMDVDLPRATDEINALNVPEDMRCRPNEGKTDQILLQWNDTNNGNASYDLYRKDVNAANWGLLTTVAGGDCGDGVCQFVDPDSSNSTVFHYRVQANDGGDTSGFSEICREPIVQNDQIDHFRAFYRLQECPTVDGKQTCTQDVNNGEGQNIHVMQMIATHEAFRQAYMDLGFKDFAFYKGARPFPIDLYPCNNGCKNSQGIQIPPANLEGTNYDPATGAGKDYEVFVVGHEAFHVLQGSYGANGDPYYKWVVEGQARSTEDKICIFGNQAQCTLWDDEIDKYYAGAAKSYLGFPEQALLESSYNAALFWTYIVEQFGTMTSEPSYGMDALVNYWEQNETNANNNATTDGIGTLNDMFTTLGSPRRFADVFQDFAVANYLKDYLSNPPAAGMAKYNYIDEETYSENGNTYGSVKLTINSPLALEQPIFGTTSVQAWGARYFQIDPDPTVPVVNVKVKTLPGTPHTLYYKVVAINNGSVVQQWDDVGTSFALSIDNAADYDRIALVVASMENPVNFTYGFNLTDGLFILSPTTQLPAAVGETTSPEKFILQVAVLDEIGAPVAGIDANTFTITVGSAVINPPANPADDAIIGTSYIAGQYWLTVRAPANPGCPTLCDLTVAYSAYTDTEEDAIVYGPKPDTDNMIIIDRSGSMLGEKIVAAQEAAKLYTDSYSEGDRIGILSFNSAPTQEYALTGWQEDNRDDMQNAIDGIDAPAGNTAAGAALREGNAKLTGQADPNPAWSIVLLSDGVDTVEDANDHIPAYISEWAAAEDNGDQVPVVHVVAVGDDADGVELSKLTNKTGGIFQFLPVPSEMAAAASEDGVDATDAVNINEALSEIYRVFAEAVLDEQQTFVSHFPLQADIRTETIHVDSAASEGIFVLKYSPANAALPTYRLIPPGGGAGDALAPTLIANGHLLWRVPQPAAGNWTMTLRFGCGQNCPQDFLIEAALVSDLTLKAYLGVPVEDRLVGKPMPIVAFLSDIAPLTGATMTALSETTGELITLHDDGLHGDGASNDGAYGGTLLSTNLPGGYSIVVDAAGTSPFAGEYTRRARLGFFLPNAPDTDKDRLPDWWEKANGTDPNVPDANQDPDGDKLPNSQEYIRKTNPLDPDTDDGGENDGSEVGRGANPLFPKDDGNKPTTFRPWPGPKRAILRLVLPKSIKGVSIQRAVELTPAVPGPFIEVFSGTTAINEFVDTSVENDQGYCYRVITTEEGGSSTSAVLCTTPKRDPNPPHGVVDSTESLALLGQVAGNVPASVIPGAVPLTVRLVLDATDDPTTEEHPAFDGAFLFPDATMSGVTQMKISNRADFADAEWEPYATSKRWTLEPSAGGQAVVFALFKDGAGNISDVAYETFVVDASLPPVRAELFLPQLDRSNNP